MSTLEVREEWAVAFDPDEILVTKTDARGRIRYVNDTFVRVSGFTREELLDAPHSQVRHADMPRGLFRYMWDTLRAGGEAFLYIRNRRADGRDFWVLSHVSPTFGPGGELRGYHSTRRLPDARAIDAMRPIYARMRRAEEQHARRAEAVQAGLDELDRVLEEWGLTYSEFVWSLINATPDEHPVVVRKDRSGAPVGLLR